MTTMIALELPDALYDRLCQTATATGRSLSEILLRAITLGAPPTWHDAPPEFQADLATLDRLDDDRLWEYATQHQTASNLARYDELLSLNQERPLTAAEQLELAQLRQAGDRFLLLKSHAIALLTWRGHRVPRPLAHAA